MNKVTIILLFILLISCSKENWRDHRYSYCYKTSIDDRYWGCNNFVVDERLSYDDSIRIIKYYDSKMKSQLPDTSYFVSRIEYLSDEHKWRTPNIKIK